MCQATIFERPCTSIFTCIYENKTITTTEIPDTSTKSTDPSAQGLSETTKIIIGVTIVVILLGIGICIACYKWKRLCLTVVTSQNHRMYATFHAESDNSIIHCDSNA